MLFAVVCTDRDNSSEIRALALADHRAYIDDYADALVSSGPLLDDDSVTRCGQLYVVDLPDRAAAEAFVREDPFTLAGLFHMVLIRRIKPVVVNGQRV